MKSPGDSRLRKIARVVLPPLVFAIVVLTLWQLYAVFGDIKESSLPKPTQVAQALWANRETLIENAWVTIKEILLGFTLAIIIGVSMALLIRSSKTAERAVYPWLVVSQMVPIPAIAPILVIWTGFDMRPKVLVIALVSFFPIAVNMIDGLRAADPELLNLLKTLKANAWQRFRKAQLPASLPFLFSGLKVAAAFSVIGAVFAEWVGASEGLGYLLVDGQQLGKPDQILAAILTFAILGKITDGLLAAASAPFLTWQDAFAPKN